MSVSFEQRRLTTPDGRDLDAYRAAIDQPTALVFHYGTPSSGLPFEPALETFAQRGLRQLSFSRPGYGSSTRRPGRSVADAVDDVAALLDDAGMASCYVIGWSGGGPHALATAALMPERVLGVAIIGCVAPFTAPDLEPTEGMGTENIQEFAAAMAGPAELSAFLDLALPAYRQLTAAQIAEGLGDLIDEVDRGSLSGDFAEWQASSVREGLRDGYWGWFDDDLAFIKPWGFDLADIRVPVHIWQGGHDRMVPFTHGQWLARHLPTACPHLLPEHGHLSLGVDAMPLITDELLAR